MSPFTKPASETPFSRLPPELATVIFDLVSAKCRPNAASCRLVCQDFYTLCSPFLVQTIVIAERYKTLRKARELLLHPYFRKHITHLLWDASYYEEYIATDYREYQSAFKAIRHVPMTRNADYRNLRMGDAILQEQLRREGPTAPSIPPSLRGAGRLLDYDVPTPAEDERDRSISRSTENPETACEYDIRGHPELPESRQFHTVEIQELDHMRGCHVGYLDYSSRWANQESIRGRDVDEEIDSDTGQAKDVEKQRFESGEWDVDGNLARHFFNRAIDELPNLRHITYGDYRSLAYDGETYLKLCRRLFNRTICPSFGFTDPDAQWGFQMFLYDLMGRERTWTSVSIGRHPFETSYIDQGFSRDQGPSARKQLGMTYDTLFHESYVWEGRELHTQSLRLPVLVTDIVEVDELGRLSQIVNPGIFELDLGVHTFAANAAGMAESATPVDVFRPLLVRPQLDFPNLKSVSLRGFMFNTTALKELLLGLASTLHTLRLVDCWCPNSYDAFLSLAKDRVAPGLALNAVELYGLRFNDSVRYVGDRSDGLHVKEYRLMRQSALIYDYSDLAMRPNTRMWDTEALEKRSRLAGFDMVSGWPYERPELEDAMLGGRANNVVRHMHTAETQEARDHWYDLPISYA